jgi:hypothetical protein
VCWLYAHYLVSQRRVCELMAMAESSYRYRSRRDDEELRGGLVELAREKPRYGYRRLQVLLRKTGERVNHKRVYRVYREAGLLVRRKRRKRLVGEGLAKPVLTGEETAQQSGYRHRQSSRDSLRSAPRQALRRAKPLAQVQGPHNDLLREARGQVNPSSGRYWPGDHKDRKS